MDGVTVACPTWSTTGLSLPVRPRPLQQTRRYQEVGRRSASGRLARALSGSSSTPTKRAKRRTSSRGISTTSTRSMRWRWRSRFVSQSLDILPRAITRTAATATAVQIMGGRVTLEAADMVTRVIGIEVGVDIHIEGGVEVAFDITQLRYISGLHVLRPQEALPLIQFIHGNATPIFARWPEPSQSTRQSFPASVLTPLLVPCF